MMQHFAQRNLVQDVTYWGPGDYNLYGQQAFAAPVLIKGRWEGKVQQVRKTTGEEITSMATVYVSQDVVVAGHLALGDYTADATPPADIAREIQSFMTIPDLRNLGTERVAFL